MPRRPRSRNLSLFLKHPHRPALIYLREQPRSRESLDLLVMPLRKDPFSLKSMPLQTLLQSRKSMMLIILMELVLFSLKSMPLQVLLRSRNFMVLRRHPHSLYLRHTAMPLYPLTIRISQVLTALPADLSRPDLTHIQGCLHSLKTMRSAKHLRSL